MPGFELSMSHCLQTESLEQPYAEEIQIWKLKLKQIK